VVSYERGIPVGTPPPHPLRTTGSRRSCSAASPHTPAELIPAEPEEPEPGPALGWCPPRHHPCSPPPPQDSNGSPRLRPEPESQEWTKAMWQRRLERPHARCKRRYRRRHRRRYRRRYRRGRYSRPRESLLRAGVTWTSLRDRNVQRFRGGLVFKAHRLLHHSTLGLRVIKKKRRGFLRASA